MKTSEIKAAIAYEKRAIYRNQEYTVHGIRGYKINNRADIGYAIELLDKSQNIIIYANLKDVELFEK